MRNVAQEQAKYVFGTSIDSISWSVLMGRDREITRKMIGPDAVDAFVSFEGVYVAYFAILPPVQEGEEYLAALYKAPGRRMVKTRSQTPHAIKVCIGYMDAEQLRSTRQNAGEEKKALVEIFQGAGWEMGEILDPM